MMRKLRVFTLEIQIIIIMGANSLYADCIQDGGRVIEDQCYCVRMAPSSDDPGDMKLKPAGKQCPGLWGLELTFTNEELRDESALMNDRMLSEGILTIGPKSKAAVKAWAAKMTEVCNKRTELDSLEKCKGCSSYCFGR